MAGDEDDSRRAEIIAAAKAVTEQRCREADLGLDAFRWRSVCRLNVLEKSPP